MNYDIVFFKPIKYEECLKYIEHIKSDRYVHINLSEAEEAVKKRILDFIGGALFIQEGKMIFLGEDIVCTIPKLGKYFMDYEIKTEKKMASFDEEEEIVRKFKK